MSTYRSVAASVAESKRKHPEDFCPVDRCLWRTGGGHCPRHVHLAAAPAPAIEPAVCFSCGKEMERPAATIKLGGDFVPMCSMECIETAVTAELDRIRCPFCELPTPPGDRLPVPTNEGRFCHAGCALDATKRLGLPKVATLLRRTGPAFSTKGGRS